MQRTLVRLLGEWGESGFHHAVITLRDAGSLAATLPDHVACRALNIKGKSHTSWWRLAGVLRGLKPDILHARGAGCWSDALLASMLLPSARVILGFHGWDTPGAVSRPARWAAKVARRSGAVILTVSQRVRDQLSGEIAVPADEIHVIANGVDTRQFQPATVDQRAVLRGRLGLAPTDLVVGTVGSLVPVKRHNLLLDAFAAISAETPGLRLLIVGEGPMRDTLWERAAAMGLQERVRFLGHRDDVHQILPALDMYVCTSDSEGQSNALLEALASGLPVVSTDVGDHAAILRSSQAGLVVPIGDADALTLALRQLIADESLRRSLGEKARRAANGHDLPTMAANYQAYYRSLVPNGWHLANAKPRAVVAVP